MFRENLGLRIFAFLMAVFVWLQSQLVNEHRTEVNLPVNLKSIPKNITLEKLPQSIPFIVKGKGFDIIKLVLSHTKVSVDASKIQPGIELISLTDYTIDLPENVNVTLIGPADQQNIAVKADEFHQKRVPVKLSFDSTLTRQRFDTLKYSIYPERVTVFGPKNKVQAIQSVSTEFISRELSNKSEFILKLSSMGEDVSYSETQVRIKLSVDQSDTKVMDNIPIECRVGEHCFPAKATVKVSGEVQALKNLNADMVMVTVSTERDASGLNKLDVKLPEGVELVAITPERVRVK